MSSSDAHELAADLVALGFATGRRVANAVRIGTFQALTEIKREAAQPRTAVRPRGGHEEGPRLITGSYARSISTSFRTEGTTFTGVVGTNDVRARRLEFGFDGVDALGRDYSQPSYPHFGPGFEKALPVFEAALRDAVDDAIQETSR